MNKQIKVLEHRLHRALVKFNEAIAANKDLREEIDNLRREYASFVITTDYMIDYD